MKIAIISSCFLPIIDGVTISGWQRLERLSKWGHQVLLFCPDYSSLEADYPHWREYTGNILPGVRVVSLESSSFVGLQYERNVTRKSYQTVWQELEAFQPDIIHVDEPERLFVGFWRSPGVDWARRANIPCVAFFRTNFLAYLQDYFPFPDPLAALIKFAVTQIIVGVYNCYDRTLVTSSITHPQLVALGIKNTLHRNLVGFDAARFQSSQHHPNFFAEKYQLPQVDKQIKIVFLGRLYPDKGWNFTLQAVPLLLQQINADRVAFIVAGDGPMREEIKAKLTPLTPNIHFLGRIPPEDVPQLLVNCDFHITTSEKEARGLTILEAFAAGIPVIAPHSGGVVENITDGRNGLLFKPGDHNDFVQKVKLLIENKTLRQEMGDRAKITVQNYSWDHSIQNLVQIWQTEINSKQKSRDRSKSNLLAKVR
jgi:glycosyltransferase involved in cell wall biosynthesis